MAMSPVISTVCKIILSYIILSLLLTIRVYVKMWCECNNNLFNNHIHKISGAAVIELLYWL